MEALLPGKKSQDRFNLCCRIFRLKLKELLHLIIDKEIFAKVNGRVYVVKFQKRGLPQAHMLWVLDAPYKPKTPKDIDKIVCAELPDPNDMELFDCVASHMIHGPCGSTNPRCPCMKEGKCSNKFPKEFIGSTQVNNDRYPLYLRRNNGRFIQKGSHLIDNRWVVPYNKYLCKVFKCHINVEIGSSIQSVKYLYKYIYKGHDRIQARVSSMYAPIDFAIAGTAPNSSSHDEAQQYLDARYVSASKSFWRICKFSMQKLYPIVYALQVHDENMQSVVYAEGEPVSEVMDSTRYYLRLMLHHVTRATCYEDLRTIDVVVYDTYQRAAAACGLLHSDAEFDNDLALASGVASPRQGRELFAMMLLYCEISQPVVHLEKYLEAMSEDICFENNALEVTNQIQRKVLSALESILYHNGSSLEAFLGLPQSVELQPIETICRPSHENNILNAILAVEHLQGMLNQEQRQLYDTVLEAIESAERAKEAKVFFVDGTCGFGKTFLYSAILAKMKASRLTAISTATSDGANQLLAKTFLTPLNDDVVKVNNMVLDDFPGEATEYISFDAIPPGEVNNKSLYPIEFLDTIDDATMPLHKLRLKIGCIVILLRNLNTLQASRKPFYHPRYTLLLSHQSSSILFFFVTVYNLEIFVVRLRT
ncbi:uncharacterized protein LOC144712627 [Wolffia australiana]